MEYKDLLKLFFQGIVLFSFEMSVVLLVDVGGRFIGNQLWKKNMI